MADTRRRHGLSWEQVARARRLFEADTHSVDAIAEACTMSAGQVLYLAERDGWERQAEALGEVRRVQPAHGPVQREAQVERARALFEDPCAFYSLATIAKTVGLSQWEVYYRVGRDGWQRRARRAPRGGGADLTVRQARHYRDVRG